MSWYDEAWARRRSISIDNTGGAGGAIDAEIVVPKDWDELWDNCNQTDARDVRICAADGFTLLSYNIEGFVLATRTLEIEIDGYTATAAGMLQVWIYWDNAAATDAAAGAFVPAAAKTGYIDVGGVRGLVTVAKPERFKDLRPRTTLSKATDDTIHHTFDLGGEMELRPFYAPYSKHLEMEEVDYVNYVVETAGGAQASMITAAKTRIVAGRFVHVDLKAGSDATDYTVVLTVVTTEGRTLTYRAWLAVRDVDEA